MQFFPTTTGSNCSVRSQCVSTLILHACFLYFPTLLRQFGITTFIFLKYNDTNTDSISKVDAQTQLTQLCCGKKKHNET